MDKTPIPARTAPAWPQTRPFADRRARRPAALLALAVALGLAGCAGSGERTRAVELSAGIHLHAHSGTDDLLTAGLGEAGLRSPVPPAFAHPEQPTAAELRRRAIWTNWRGIADLAPGGGYGSVYGSLQSVPGREYHAFATLPGRAQPHRLMVQLPNAFDAQKRCVVVTASSGSRGVYGAIALAGAWGLPRGCAVAYTDKGAGTGYVEAGGTGFAIDGQVAAPGETAEFAPKSAANSAAPLIAVKHAHSGDNPEADWGRHVQQAARFALQVLESAHGDAGPWTFDNTRVIAVGVSNGGGAVLRAAEIDGDWLDAVVAVSPNVQPGDGGRALYDYGTEAAVWMPCALNAKAFDGVQLARPNGGKHPAGTLRCASLKASGRIEGDSAEAQAEAAHAKLKASGWTDEALAAGALSTGFDLWRAVNVTYASAYARTPVDAMPCGYGFAALGPDGKPRAPTAAERAAWWSDGSGIPPGTGIGLVDGQASGADATLPGLDCLRGLWNDDASAVRAGIAGTRAALPRTGLPVIVVHGADDGLVPEAFSGAAYARWADANGRPVSYWRVRNAQHFDAFLGLPVLGMRYVPMLPYGYRALDAAWATVAEGQPLPADADIATTPRKFSEGALAPLSPENLGTLP
jgi:hydroxybutyrate-dimer hydrolase